MSAKKVHSNTTRLANATLSLGLAVSLSATAMIATAEPTPSSQPTATATATPQTTHEADRLGEGHPGQGDPEIDRGQGRHQRADEGHQPARMGR